MLVQRHNVTPQKTRIFTFTGKRSSNLGHELVYCHSDIKLPFHEIDEACFLFYSLLLGAVDYLKSECPLNGLQNNSLDKKSEDFLIKRLKRNVLLLLYKVPNNNIICCCGKAKTGCLDEIGFSGSLPFHMMCYTNVNYTFTSQDEEGCRRADPSHA